MMVIAHVYFMFFLVKCSFNLFQFPYSITTCHSLFLGDQETFLFLWNVSVYQGVPLVLNMNLNLTLSVHVLIGPMFL